MDCKLQAMNTGGENPVIYEGNLTPLNYETQPTSAAATAKPFT